MLKFLFSLLFVLSSLYLFSQSHSDGFTAGYKAGYCYNDYGCVAPPCVPSVAKVGRDTYQDGYNDGFAKGQADRASNETKLHSQSGSSNASGDINGAMNSGIGQAQQNRMNDLEIKLKRIELEKEQIELLKAREQQENEYEQKTIKKPEIDFQSGTTKKFKVKSPNKYSLQIFNPEKWAEILEYNSGYVGQRTYDDGTIFGFIIKVIPSPTARNNAEYLDSIYLACSKKPKLFLGISGDSSGNGFLVKSFASSSCAYNSGIRIGDIITKIDGNTITDSLSLQKSIYNKNVGDSTIVEIIRNSEKYYTMVKLDKEEGFYYGKFMFNDFPAVFKSYVSEYEDYGVTKEWLFVDNSVAINGDVFLIRYFIKPSSDFVDFDKEFLRFQNSIKIHLNKITIE